LGDLFVLDTPSVDAILAAANVEQYAGKVFSIGPFGIRVGFTYQQERALNLVYALVKDTRIAVGHKILVVGGGLSGITAKIALHAMGYGKVHLIEALDDILMVQQDATHRMLHPCYNNWPLVDRFSPTSDLPFLNWYSASASKVTSFLRTRWEKIYSGTLSRIRVKHSLKHLKLTPDKNRVIAQIESIASNLISDEEFDLVILATGFGDEQDLRLSAVRGYWEPDRITSLRSATKSHRVFVSGIGDGGLMDFARLAFKAVPDSDLAIETISRLRHSRYQHPRISLDEKVHVRSPVEQEISSVEKRALYLLPQNTPDRTEFGSPVENEIATFLANSYRSIIEMLPAMARKFLDDQLHEVLSTGRLLLVGRLAAPFTCATAPINKLLIGYLLARQPSLYCRGFIDCGTGELVTETGRESLALDTLIIRHGGLPPVFDVSPSFAKQTRQLNRSMADLVDKGRPPSNQYTDLHHVVSAGPFSPPTIAYIVTLAEEFAAMNPVNLSLSHKIDASKTNLWFEFNPEMINGRQVAISGRLGGIPHEIFGKKLVAREPMVASTALGTDK
jgi:hypothetical protein